MNTFATIGGTQRRVDLARPIDLSVPIDFSEAGLRHFGAPAPRSAPFATTGFTGDVGRGASCNCRTLTLTPHCHGTHTECVAHLTREPLDAWRLVPVQPLAAIVVSVTPERIGDDCVVTRDALLAAWPQSHEAPSPIALILRTAHPGGTEPPYVATDAAALVVARGIAHLVIDQPSLDRTHDEGRLAAHRVFFGLPAGSRSLGEATRAFATVTELAQVPDALPDGACALAWQVPAIAGDAVPSRPLAYRYET
ncbi:MAG: cyclase family protein [Steroidobacteraceae bacterium]